MTTQEQLQKLEEKITQLETKVKGFEDIFSSNGANLEELIRNTVFYDLDTTTAVTRVAVASLVTGNVTVPPNPTRYIRAYFRGQPYNIAVYAIT